MFKSIQPDAILEVAVLRNLDAMPTTTFDNTTDIRAQARLEQIMATNPYSQSSPKPRALNSARVWRWAAVPAIAAAGLALSVLAPHSPTIQPAHASLASWTALPTSLTGENAVAADNACRATMAAIAINPSGAGELHWENDGWVMPPMAHNFAAGFPEFFASPVIASTRGEWGTVLYVNSDGTFATCLMWLPPDSTAITASLNVFGPTDESGVFFNTELGLNATVSIRPQEIAEVFTAELIGNEVIITNATAARFINLSDEASNSAEPQDIHTVISIYGRVGSEVTDLVFHTYDVGDVMATVAQGWFTAWWPARAGDENSAFIATDMFADATVTLSDGSSFEAPLSAIAHGWGIESMRELAE